MMKGTVRVRFSTALMSLALTLVSACSLLSSSSDSVSSSIASSSRSSSSSSGGGYQEDVSDYTAAHIQSGGTVAELRRQIGLLAAKHGVADWENDPSTFEAVGRGLAKAGYRQVQVDAFKNNFATNPEQAQWIQKGFDSKH